MAEINVTPFVDVVLVLLIIFIITARVMDYGIEVQVPKTKSVASALKDTPAVVLLSAKGDLFVNHDAVNIGDLNQILHAKFPGQTDVFVRADAKTPWELVANVGATLGAGQFKINFVTVPADAGKSR